MMESYEEAKARENAEDAAFETEKELLLKLLNSRQRWSRLPWVDEIPSTLNKIFFEKGSALLNPRRCWRVLDTELHLSSEGDVLYHDGYGKMVCAPADYFRRKGQVVFLTEKMREMRENL